MRVSRELKTYLPLISATENQKGVLDVDTVKGCSLGMAARPDGGCYGECYAAKTAARYGIDFSVSVSRKLLPENFKRIFNIVKKHHATWYRIGVSGDPCHDWENTISVCEQLKGSGKTPVIITKHWIPLTDAQIVRLYDLNAVVNTSTSGLDTDAQIKFRVRQIERLKDFGVKSINRVVTCDFGETEWAKKCKEKQDYLLTITPIIDNPLRAPKSNRRVLMREIIISRQDGAVGGGKFVSLHSPDVYLGTCDNCPDQCGADRPMNAN